MPRDNDNSACGTGGAFVPGLEGGVATQPAALRRSQWGNSFARTEARTSVELIVLVARLALAIIFVISAIAKVRDHAGARQAVIDFGVPVGLATPIAFVLAPLELLTAGLLLTAGVGVVIGGALAVLLLAAFTAGIASTCFGATASSVTALVLSRPSPCRGGRLRETSSSSRWASWSSPVDRHKETSGTSSSRIFDGLSSAEAWLTAGVLVLTAVVATLTYLFFSLLQRYGAVLLRLEALEAGHGHAHGAEFSAWPAPELALVDASENELSLGDVLVNDRASMFVFVSPHCAGCAELVDELAAMAG